MLQVAGCMLQERIQRTKRQITRTKEISNVKSEALSSKSEGIQRTKRQIAGTREIPNSKPGIRNSKKYKEPKNKLQEPKKTCSPWWIQNSNGKEMQQKINDNSKLKRISPATCNLGPGSAGIQSQIRSA